MGQPARFLASDDAGEQVFVDQAVTVGVNNLSVTVPSGANVGQTFSRFRSTGTPGYSYIGLAPDGEVEDYRVSIVAASSSAPQARRPVLGDLLAALLVDRSSRMRTQRATSPVTRNKVYPPVEPVPLVVDRSLRTAATIAERTIHLRRPQLDVGLVDHVLQDDELLLDLAPEIVW